jgi:hypothetical protein
MHFPVQPLSLFNHAAASLPSLKNMKRITRALLFLVWAMASGETRMWTATDGRQIEAETIAKSDTEVVVRRTADNQIVTIPLNLLSPEDRAFVMQAPLPAKKTEDAKKEEPDPVKIAAGNFPEFPYMGHPHEAWKRDIVNDPQCREFYNSYKSTARFIDRNTREIMVARLRSKIEADKAVLGRNLHDANASSRRTNSTWFAARQNLRWLDRHLIPWLDKVEAAK